MRKYNNTIVVVLFFIVIFTVNLSINFLKYLEVSFEEVYKDEVQVINIYEKEDFNVIKLKAKDYSYFTSIPKDFKVKKLEYYTVIFVSKNLSFYEYLKGFYAKTFYIYDKEKNTLKQDLAQEIQNIHKDKDTAQLFNALFFAIPVSTDLREVFTNYSISHLIALSGFHIALLSFILYWIFYYPYNFIHQRYFPYRNKKADLGVFILVLIFIYLVFTDFIPSLLRAFIMSVCAFYFLRTNIKLLSFQSLGLTFLIVVSLFPKYLFSLGFWFSMSAVFYIFLYIKYFSLSKKWIHFILFNTWIFLVFNPIVHYFFPQTSFEQFYSIPLTMIFSIFYPFEIFLHLVGQGTLLDTYLIDVFSSTQEVYLKGTNIVFLLLYVFISFLSILRKEIFYLLNFLMIGFNVYLYVI